MCITNKQSINQPQASNIVFVSQTNYDVPSLESSQSSWIRSSASASQRTLDLFNHWDLVVHFGDKTQVGFKSSWTNTREGTQVGNGMASVRCHVCPELKFSTKLLLKMLEVASGAETWEKSLISIEATHQGQLRHNASALCRAARCCWLYMAFLASKILLACGILGVQMEKQELAGENHRNQTFHWHFEYEHVLKCSENPNPAVLTHQKQ